MSISRNMLHNNIFHFREMYKLQKVIKSRFKQQILEAAKNRDESRPRYNLESSDLDALPGPLSICAKLIQQIDTFKVRLGVNLCLKVIYFGLWKLIFEILWIFLALFGDFLFSIIYPWQAKFSTGSSYVAIYIFIGAIPGKYVAGYSFV